MCSVCHELWPTCVAFNSCSVYMCTRCKRDKDQPKQYSAENDMHPGTVPPWLQGLTHVEMIIARACPIMCVYWKHGGQRGYKGHVVSRYRGVSRPPTLQCCQPSHPDHVPSQCRTHSHRLQSMKAANPVSIAVAQGEQPLLQDRN